MIQQEFCQDCHQKHDCQEVYRQLGHATCPSITRKVIVAFLLPLVIFIVFLAIFDNFFAAAGINILHPSRNDPPATAQHLQTAISFLMALLVTFVCMFVTRVVTKRLRKDF